MKRGASALVFFLAASFLGFCEPQFIVQTGHTGPITALEYHPLLKQLVSAGSDGTVKVWETDTYIALFMQRIAPRAIMRLAIHPVKPYFAAAYEQNEKYKVSVWDWTLNKELYVLTFENKPLFIDFSVRGTYLAICLEDWKSLFIFDAEKGEQMSSPVSGFGIISYVMFSSKETTVMTYQPSGKIIYWELGTGKRLNEIKAPAGLVPLTLSNNKVQLICADHDQIVFIDVLSGKQSSNQELPGMVLTRSDRQSMTIASFRRTPGGKDMIHASIITEKSIKDSFATALFENSMITALAIAGETIFAGNLYGDIFRVTRSGTGKIVKNNLFPATDMALHKNKIILSSQNQLVVIKSDYFKTLASTDSLPTEMAVAVFNQPFPGNRVGLESLGENGLFLWRYSGNPAALFSLDPQIFSLKNQVTTFNSALVNLKMDKTYCLSIEQNGLCQVTSIKDPPLNFKYQSSGVNAMVFIPPARIIVGKSRISSFGSSLVDIVGDTGETTFLQDPADVIFNLAYDDNNKILFYTGIEKINDVPATVVKSRSNELTGSPTRIFTKAGQYYSSRLACDTKRGWLYFSLEENVMYRWDGKEIKSLEPSIQSISKIVVNQNIIYALNDNASITAWDTETLQIIFHIFIFENGTWALITKDGRYCTSANFPDQFVKLIDNGREARDLLSQLKLDTNVSTNVKD